MAMMMIDDDDDDDDGDNDNMVMIWIINDSLRRLTDWNKLKKKTRNCLKM